MLPVLLLDFSFMPGGCLNTHFPFCLISFDRYFLQPSSLWKEVFVQCLGRMMEQSKRYRWGRWCAVKLKTGPQLQRYQSVPWDFSPQKPEGIVTVLHTSHENGIKSLRDLCNSFNGILWVSEAKYLVLKSLAKLFLAFPWDQIPTLSSRNS